MPYRFPIVNNNVIQYDNIRIIRIKNYIAFYRINETEKLVIIERILFGGMNFK